MITIYIHMYLAAGLLVVAKTVGRVAHDCPLRWSERELSATGNSYKVPWQCWPVSWNDSLSSGDEATQNSKKEGLIFLHWCACYR